MYNACMQFKQVGIALGILIILGVIFGFWASQSGSGMQKEESILGGEQIGEGDEYVYTEKGDYYTIEAHYPKSRPVVEQALADRIAQFKKDGNFANLTAEDVQIQGLGPDRKYALDLEYKHYISAGYHSYAYTVYEDTLGAHPNTYFMTFVFDAKGNAVALETLFRADRNWLEELSLLVSNDVSAQYRARSGAKDLTGLLFPEGLAPKVENFQNFVLDGDQFVIMIPPYQVAAYAVGSFEVKIPLVNLKDLLKPGLFEAGNQDA
ncbi:DUF3298 domain-containing protein [Candidatus Kaiserbacteria bacterium]|nr:DUF3298 domain-containing protein [Candidatus Kaiserbacteria bacterium]